MNEPMPHRVIRIVVASMSLVLAAAGCSGASDPVDAGRPPASDSRGTGEAAPRTATTARQTATTSLAPATTRPRVSRFRPGPIAVIDLGDSLTAGSGDPTGLGYPGRLQKALTERGREGSTVTNLGKAGWTSQQLIDGWAPDRSQLGVALEDIVKAKRENKPVVATLLIGCNDLWQLYAKPTPTTALDESNDLERYRKNIRWVVDGLKAEGAIVVIGITDDQSRRPSAREPARRLRVYPSIEDAELPRLSAQAHRYADAVRQIATDTNSLLVDFLEAPFFVNPFTLSGDADHPNDRGYQEMTDLWLAAMDPLL